MIDVTHRISAVARTVGTRTLAAGEARVVTVARSYPDPVEEVWNACTAAERITRWLMPVSGELRLGGRYQLQGNAGGVVESCDPPRSFTATWEYGGEVSWIELHLTPRGTARGSRWSTSRTSTTRDGPSSARARSASGGTRCSWG